MPVRIFGLILFMCSVSWAAISFHAIGSGTNSNTGTSISVSLPTVSNNDVVLLFLDYSNGSNASAGSKWTLPSGYTSCYNVRGYAVAYHLWKTGDTTSVTATVPSGGGGNWTTGIAISYSGVDTTTPVDQCSGAIFTDGTATNQNFGSSNVRAHAPNVFPNYANDMLLVGYMDATASGLSATLTHPSGFTARLANTSGPNVFSWEKQLSSNSATGTTDAATGGGNNRVGVSILLRTASDPAIGRQGPVPGFVGTWVQDSATSFDLTQYAVANNDFVTVSCVGITPKVVSTTGYTATINAAHIAVYTHLWLTGDSTTVSLTGTGNCGLNVFRNISNTTAITVDSSGDNSSTATSITSPSLSVSCLDLILQNYYSANTSSPSWTSAAEVNWAINTNASDVVDTLESFIESPTNPTGGSSGTQSVSAAMASSALALNIIGGGGCSLSTSGVRHRSQIF